MWRRDAAAVEQRRNALQAAFGSILVLRLLYPFFNQPLSHLYSDPQRHWENGASFLHPTFMGSSDPLLYQVWIFVLRAVTQDSAPGISLGCGILCAAMPYGWYRALREIQPRERSLLGAAIIGIIPESIGIYGYFMTETLLLTLLGFCFWSTLRAFRKNTLAAFAFTTVLWLCASFTRTIAVPMAAVCIAAIWIAQGGKVGKALVAAALAAIFVVPAGLHSEVRLHYFAPFGNLYFNEIYSASGKREIEMNFGVDGVYHFGCPSFYTPSFYPFSDWTTARQGTVKVAIDLRRGRAGWIEERRRAAAENTFSPWRQRAETWAHTLFSQNWPNSDHSTTIGQLTVWTRWLWAPLFLAVAVAWVKHRFVGWVNLLPLCGLGTLVLLLMQNEGAMEARYREPIDAILVCAAWVAIQPKRGERRSAAVRNG